MSTNDKDLILEAKHAKMRDMVMTWDEISDELIWDAYDVNGPEHQKIALERLEQFCIRFPHFADRLREFVERWNVDEPVTQEMLAAVEITEEEVNRGWRRAKQILNFYDKLRRVEKERDKAMSDALRWRFYATAQTALYLGTTLDPDDETVDWKIECDRLVDQRIEGSKK